MSRLTKYCEYCVDSECIWYDKELAKDNKCECNKSRDNCHDRSIYNKLREYEDLEEQGLLLKLPCKIGDTVYVIDTIYECDNDYMDCIMEFPDVYQCERGFVCEYEHEKLVVRPKSFDFKMLDNFNKTVFLTKEEAEQELKRLEGAE